MQRSLSILVHGAAKSGKSSFAVTCPAPRLYLDVESASRFLAIGSIPWDPVTEAPPAPGPTWDTAVVAVRDWATMERTYQWLASGQHPFKSVVIDSISELQQRYIDKQAGRQQLTQQQWGDAFRIISGLVRDFRDLTMHPTKPLEAVVMTAITKQIDGMWKPYLQGQVATVLPYIVDIVFYLWVETETDPVSGERREVRKLLSRRSSQFEAGERVNGRIPEVLQLKNRAPGEVGNDIELIVDLIFPSAPTPTLTTTPTHTDTEE